MHNIATALLKFLSWVLIALPAQGEENITPLPEPVAKIQNKSLSESSGLIQSRRVPGRYWTMNDGGHPAKLYVMNAEGESLATPLQILGADNRDWEAVTVDAEGGIWIGEIGNNKNKYKELMLYRVDEPGEELPESLTVTHTLKFNFPDQNAFPPQKLNFDAEAMFVWQKRMYLLTKHRADMDTKLYRIENLETPALQSAVLMNRFTNIGQVTDADLLPDGSKLVVLTFSGIWIFERPENSDQFLQGKARQFKFKNWALRQIEGVAWMDEYTLLICNEQRDLFRVRIDGEGWVDVLKDTSGESGDEWP